MSDDALRAVPAETREGALALGSTRSEMMMQVLLPAALDVFLFHLKSSFCSQDI